ncbi:MAG: EAL domain-containing protein [Gallionellaceae bacterium]|nr:EAL domain-containing protein [Gallionellaceae bacterium]
MKMNKRSTDVVPLAQAHPPDLPPELLADALGGRGAVSDSTASPSADEAAISSREQLVTAREGSASAREETADQRDSVAQIREETVYLREEVSLLREKIIQEADTIRAALENNMERLQQANQQLVIATLQAQSMAEEVQKANDQMGHMAHHDALTDLPNRTLLKERLMQAIALTKRRGTTLAVLFLDLDNFKHINDSLGHKMGDQLLQSVAKRLGACVRDSDTVSRLGGDEFVLLVSEDINAADIVLTADKILSALTTPHSIAGHELHITTSIGISIYPVDAQDADTLLKNADSAMYQAKQKGRNNYQFFKTEMHVRAVERQVIETDLRHALERQQLVLHYQPKVNLQSGMITGAEALLRWLHPEWGTVLPERFVPIAEECGLIVPIGRWVLRAACVEAKRWQDQGLQPTAVAVNISAVEFRHKDFVAGVHTILSETGLEPRYLQLEITESVLMRDAEASTAVLQQLKNMGVQLAVDDFGTGYSSLSYLKQFPIDVLKIDQSFVQDIISDEIHDDGLLVSAVIAMGKSLKQRVIAEGVEEHVQLAFLKAQDCEEGQGYFFSRPLTAEQFAALLVTGLDAKVLN